MWQTPSPGGSFAIAPRTVVCDAVLFARAGNQSAPISTQHRKTRGALLSLNKHTGKVLGEYPLDSTMHEGIAVAEGYILFGTGYEPPLYNGTGSIYVYRA